MSKYFCRALDCGMSFSTPRHRDNHQDLMHKNMMDEAAVLLINKVNNTNGKEALSKKIIKVQDKAFSYAEAKEMVLDKNNEDGKAILKIIKNVIEMQFLNNPDYGIKQLIQIFEFKIH